MTKQKSNLIRTCLCCVFVCVKINYLRIKKYLHVFQKSSYVITQGVVDMTGIYDGGSK